jgi:hypothetical protein
MRSYGRWLIRARRGACPSGPAGTTPGQSWRARRPGYEVSPRSRSTVRNGCPASIASRSCCLTSSGSRFCALARPNALSLSLCARRHRSQWQPLFHPALVPCAVPLLTRVRVAKSPLAATCRRSSLEEHGRDDRDVKHHRRTDLASPEISGPVGAGTPAGPEPRLTRSRDPCPKLPSWPVARSPNHPTTRSASSWSSPMTAIVRITWPPQPTVIDPPRFGETAAALVKMFSEAHVALAAIRVRRPL